MKIKYNSARRLQKNVGRFCFIKLVPGMTNPHGVNIAGVAVAPQWEEYPSYMPKGMIRRYTPQRRETNRPRVCEIVGVQIDYRHRRCYTVRSVEDPVGSYCVHPSGVILIDLP